METPAAKNLFSTAQSERGRSESGGGFTRFEERGEQAPVTYGPVRLNQYQGLPYDYGAALIEARVPVKVSMHRVMTSVQASDALKGLMTHVNMQSQGDAFQYAYHRGILLAYAKNSASTIQPDRAEIVIGKGPPINFFLDVMRPLGVDARRFFRAYADMTRAILREVLKKFGEGDQSYADDYRDIMWVAHDRGLSRYPDLIHDGADAGSDLSVADRTAISQAKASLFSQVKNVTDVVQLYRQATAKGPQVSAFSPTVEDPGY